MNTSPAHFLNMLKFSTGLDALSLTPIAKFSNALSRARQLAASRSLLVPRLGQRIDDLPFEELPLREVLRPATQYADDGLSSMLVPRIGQRVNAAPFGELPLREALRPATQYTDEGLGSMLIPRIGYKQSNVSQRASMLTSRIQRAGSNLEDRAEAIYRANRAKSRPFDPEGIESLAYGRSAAGLPLGAAGLAALGGIGAGTYGAFSAKDSLFPNISKEIPAHLEGFNFVPDSKYSNVSQRASMLMNRLGAAASGARAGFNSVGRAVAAPPPPSLMQRFRRGVGSVSRSAVPIAGVGAGMYAAGGMAGYGAGSTNAGSLDDAVISTYDNVSNAYGGVRDAVTEFGRNAARQASERVNSAVQGVRNVQLPNTIGEGIDAIPSAVANAASNLR